MKLAAAFGAEQIRGRMFCFRSLAGRAWLGSLGSRILKDREELSGRKRFEGANAASEFGGGQTAFAIEKAEKIGGGLAGFEGVAFEAAGDEVAVGIQAGVHARHNVVEAQQSGCEPAKTVKAAATLARMDGLAQSPVLSKVGVLEMEGRGRLHGFVRAGLLRADGENLEGKPHFDHVSRLAALEQAESAQMDQAADGLANGIA